MISNRISMKLRDLSFLAMCSVILLHAGNLDVAPNPASWNVLFHKWVDIFQTWAVPYFFIVSGFFFDRGSLKEGGGGIPSIWIKTIRKKLHTLVLPYFVWGIIGALLSLPLIISTNLKTGSDLFARTVFDCSSLWQFFNGLLGVTCPPKGNAPLGFVRTLILIFILSPMWLLLRRTSKWGLGMISIFFIIYMRNVYILTVSVNMLGIGFFLMGMFISSWCLEEKKVPLPLSLLGGGMFIFLAYIEVVYNCKGFWSPFVPCFLIVLIWGIYDVIGKIVPCHDVSHFSQISFFVYCFHNSIAATLNGACGFILGKNDYAVLFTFFFSFIVTTGLSILVAVRIRDYFPRFNMFLSGGR